MISRAAASKDGKRRAQRRDFARERRRRDAFVRAHVCGPLAGANVARHGA